MDLIDFASARLSMVLYVLVHIVSANKDGKP